MVSGEYAEMTRSVNSASKDNFDENTNNDSNNNSNNDSNNNKTKQRVHFCTFCQREEFSDFAVENDTRTRR